jgi:hypothetical protein
MMDYWKTFFLVLLAGTALAGEPIITCEPRELRGVPGEPLRMELTAETDRANPVQLRIPAVSNLVLRTVEKIPIQRTKDGRFVQKRVIIWQGLQAGSILVTNLSVQIGAAMQLLPSIGITVDAVEPANPPRPAAAPPVEGNETNSMQNPLLGRGAETAGRVLR